MIEPRKILIFLFVLVLFVYMFYTILHSIKEYELKKSQGRVMIIGLAMDTIATFLDMISNISNGKFDMIMRAFFTVGSVTYIIGMALWDRYLRKTIFGLYKISQMDSMTGAYNRKGIEEAFKRTVMAKEKFFIMVFDLDETKRINDTFGHLSGDKYIIESSRIITDEIGIKGFLGRTGGDEFMALIGHLSNDEIEKIKLSIKARVTKIFPGQTTRISIGYALYEKEGKTLKELIAEADLKMYEDKKNWKKVKSNN